MGPDAATLRRELRHLLAQHVPHDYLGAFTDDPADLEIAQRFCRTLLDFIGSWEWTIPGGSSEIQRTIIAERGLGLPRG
jgi:hypothetical protein